MSSSSDQNTEVSDGKLATESAPAGINSITNTVGMHPPTNETSPPIISNIQRGSCDHPGCTAEHTNNRELDIATHNRAQDLDIADNQRKDFIFNECLKTLSKLIEKYDIELNQSSSASLVARFTTLFELNRLDYAKLISYRPNNYQPPILLYSVNLTDLNLIDECDRKELFHLSLENTIMIRVDFHQINIHGARFNQAILTNADFSSTSNIPSSNEIDRLENNLQ